mgnify:CR=1 FL=1
MVSSAMSAALLAVHGALHCCCAGHSSPYLFPSSWWYQQHSWISTNLRVVCWARLLQVPYNAYSNALKTRPLLTKACTSMVGFVLGDLIAQVSCRTAQLLAAGFLWMCWGCQQVQGLASCICAG